MTPLRIDEDAELSHEAQTELRAAIELQNTLQAAVRWAFERGYRLLDVFEQDEFTRDVVFEMGPGLYLAYDAT